MKLIIFLVVAFSLPFLGRFQETKVFENGKIVYEQSTYGQKVAAEWMIVAAIALLAEAHRQNQKRAGGRSWRLIRIYPALFALPAAWQTWTVSRFGAAGFITEIKAGLGGPMTWVLVAAAAALFIAGDAYWRQKKAA
ncbi:MAG TPA: hypothetical protein VFJ90_00255 [Candidatus Didemnitutus sp.]|nr:hypothetical protein [Candidatus Didemnitutus sp.]